MKNNEGEEIIRTQRLMGEMSYWKYRYDLHKLGLSEGRYWLVIEIKQNHDSVKVFNMFEVFDNEYLFAKEAISKKY